MLTELQEEQASLYALDLLDGSELTAFQRDMLAKPELQLLVEDLRLCRDVLIHESAALPPPAPLKDKVLARIQVSARPPRASVPEKRSESVSMARLFVPWALAACMTFLSAWLSMDRKKIQEKTTLLQNRVLQQERSLAKAKAQNADQARTIAQLESQNLLQAGTIAQLKATSDQANPWTQSAVSVLWDKKRQEGVLVLSHMPAAETGKIYQLWVIDPESQGPVSAGTFEVRADGSARILFRPSRQVRQAAQFAVSLEEGGEKQKPEGPVILAGASL